MKMLKTTTAALLLAALFTSNINGQESDSRKVTNKTSFTATFMPLSIIDPSPRIRLGGEFLFNHKYSVSVDFGFGDEFISYEKENRSNADYNLWEIRPEFKAYKHVNKYIAFYAATELFYINHNDKYLDSHYQSESGNTVYYNSTDYHRVKYGVNFKGGFKATLMERISLEAYAGIGVRARQIDYSNTSVIENDDYYFFEGWDNYISNKEGNSVNLNIAAGIRIGFVLFANK